MKLHFFRLSQYPNFADAKQGQALRTIFLDDVENPTLRTKQAADIVEAVVLTVGMMDGGESVQFVLTTDDDVILDTF